MAYGHGDRIFLSVKWICNPNFYISDGTNHVLRFSFPTALAARDCFSEHNPKVSITEVQEENGANEFFNHKWTKLDASMPPGKIGVHLLPKNPILETRPHCRTLSSHRTNNAGATANSLHTDVPTNAKYGIPQEQTISATQYITLTANKDSVTHNKSSIAMIPLISRKLVPLWPLRCKRRVQSAKRQKTNN